MSPFTVNTMFTPLPGPKPVPPPPMETVVAPVNPDPEMTTLSPAFPLEGEKLATKGGGSTVKVGPVVVPTVLVTRTGPVEAPNGTMASIWPSDWTLKKPERTPLNVTLLVPVNAVPEIVTRVPCPPDVGFNEEIVGADAERTLNVAAEEEVPPIAETAMGPLAAPSGTVAVICPSLFTVNIAL